MTKTKKTGKQIAPDRFQKLLASFKLELLFNELGWDHANRSPKDIQADGETFQLRSIAQKRDVFVFLCSPDKESYRQIWCTASWSCGLSA
ncbi:hypothetical protein F4X33_01320, partial [Candidatus Poribacteria bacterium]|nr:hypothetical protein [Candidatus Poribacteria bacterium]